MFSSCVMWFTYGGARSNTDLVLLCCNTLWYFLNQLSKLCVLRLSQNFIMALYCNVNNRFRRSETLGSSTGLKFFLQSGGIRVQRTTSANTEKCTLKYSNLHYFPTGIYRRLHCLVCCFLTFPDILTNIYYFVKIEFEYVCFMANY